MSRGHPAFSVWRVLVIALSGFLLLTPAWAHQGADTGDTADARLRTLIEISETVRAPLTEAFEQASTALRAVTPEDRQAGAQAFTRAAEAARGAINAAHQRLHSLPPIVDADPEFEALARSHQGASERGLEAGLSLLDRLERVVAANNRGEQIAVAEQGLALLESSILLVRQAADQARLRAKLTPQFPWVEPMDNAMAELMDGMASLIELRITPSAQQPSVRDEIRANAERMRAYLRDGEAALATEPADPVIAAVLADRLPAIRERAGWANQAAAELEAGAQAGDVNRQREHLDAARALYRQIVASQQSMLR